MRPLHELAGLTLLIDQHTGELTEAERKRLRLEYGLDVMRGYSFLAERVFRLNDGRVLTIDDLCAGRSSDPQTDAVNRLGVALANELSTQWNGNPWRVLDDWEKDHDKSALAKEIRQRFAAAFAVGQAVALHLDASHRYPVAIESLQAKMYGWIEHAALNRLREIAGLPQVHGPGCECPR